MGEIGLMFNAMDDETYDIIQRHIPDFGVLSDEVKQEISSFTWLWSSFEGKHCGTIAAERNLSNFASRDLVSNMIATEHVVGAWDHFKDRYLTGADAQNRLDHLMGNIPNRGQTIRQAISTGLGDNANDSEKSIALVLIVYRFRNNLFHGQKGRNGFVDQLGNFQHANTLLRLWIEVPPTQ